MASLNEMDIVSDSVARSLSNVSLESEQKAVIKDFVTVGNDRMFLLCLQLATVKASVVMLR